ncbi:MAG TPA: hypothetical protein VHB48_10025 [Chitinophagaceae bacterium]|nr:hypothetical protein [Chitinophagaceae bacterium]
MLKVTGNNIILASLPSSQSHLPQKQVIQHGCLEIPETCITCYIFEAGRPVTQAGWAFELHTFLHGHWLNDYTLEMMQLNYVIEGVDYEITGDLTEAELLPLNENIKDG